MGSGLCQFYSVLFYKHHDCILYTTACMYHNMYIYTCIYIYYCMYIYIYIPRQVYIYHGMCIHVHVIITNGDAHAVVRNNDHVLRP